MHGARFRQKFALDDVIELHAFAPLEAQPSVRSMTLLSDIHSSYRLAL
jgi:hypothetical protein